MILPAMPLLGWGHPLVSCPINSLAFVAIKMGCRTGICTMRVNAPVAVPRPRDRYREGLFLRKTANRLACESEMSRKVSGRWILIRRNQVEARLPDHFSGWKFGQFFENHQERPLSPNEAGHRDPPG